MLAVQPICAVAASYHFEPNPVGEKVYVSDQRGHLVTPIAIVAVGFSLAGLIARARRKTRKLAPENAASQHGA